MALSSQEKEQEFQVKLLSGILENKGFSIRRENLSRGHSFRVKSGDCVFSGQNVIFLDRRLPLEQQISLLIDYIIYIGLELSKTEEDSLSGFSKKILATRRLAKAA